MTKWSGYWPHNQEVMGSIPGLATLVLLFPCAKNFTHIALVYPAVKWGPGGLDGEVAHLAVTSMGTWCKLGKQISNCCKLDLLASALSA